MNKNFGFVWSISVVAVCVMPVAGCRRQGSADQGSSIAPQHTNTVAAAVPPPQTAAPVPPPQLSTPNPPPQSPAPEPPVATPDAALQKLQSNSGLVFSADTKVLGFGNGGVSDPSIGFYEWVILSPTHLALPNGLQPGNKEVLSLPVPQAVQLVESKMGDEKVANPLTAFSISWQKNGFAFSGTWVRGQGADYLIVQQTRL